MKIDKVDQIFDEFKNAKILVIGDVMIDCYLTGKVSRISPEAPVPIVNVQSRSYRLGGAANVALNLKSLGADPILCSVIGSDSKAKVFYNLMEDCDLTSDAIVPMFGRRTTIKYRIIGNDCHIVRVDDERVQQLKEREKRQFLTTVEQIIDHNDIDALIFEDYDKGLFSQDLISEIIAFAHKKNIYVAVDPKEKNFNNYTNVNLFKPNMKELTKGLHMEENVELSLDEIHEVAKDFGKAGHRLLRPQKRQVLSSAGFPSPRERRFRCRRHGDFRLHALPAQGTYCGRDLSGFQPGRRFGLRICRRGAHQRSPAQRGTGSQYVIEDIFHKINTKTL